MFTRIGTAITTAGLTLALGAPALAADAPPWQPNGAVTLVGRGDGPVVEVNPKTGAARELPKSVVHLNRVTPDGMKRTEKRHAAIGHAIAASRLQEQADEKAKVKADALAKINEVKEKAAKVDEAREKLDVEAAEIKMRSLGWQDQTPDGKILFNPNTMSFQKREDVVKQLLPGVTPENPVAPGTPPNSNLAPPPPADPGEPRQLNVPPEPQPPAQAPFPEQKLKPPLY